MKTNFKISQFSKFLLRSGYAIKVKIWKWLKLLNFFHSSRNHKEFMFRIEFDHFDWLSQFCSEYRQFSKIRQFSRLLLRSRYSILFKIWKWLKLFNSVPFIKKTLANHVFNWVWSFEMSFINLQWMKTNVKISQFEEFC